MFSKKKQLKQEQKKIFVEISDFSKGLNFDKDENALDPNYCVNTFNFAYKNGVLTENYGLKNLQCPNYEDETLNDMKQYWENEVVNFKKVWMFKVYDEFYGGRVDKLLFYSDTQKLFFSRIITSIPLILEVSSKVYSEMPDFAFDLKIDGVDYNIFGSEKIGVYRYDGAVEPVVCENLPPISSICEFKGKLYGTTYGEKNLIYFHNNLNLLSWRATEDEFNGKIEMNDSRGKINKVIPFLDYLFAIRDYGISKISVLGKLGEHNVTHLSLSGYKIYENTVAICGDKMLMLTKQGIAEFNGVWSKVLDISVNEMLKNVENSAAVCAFHAGKYYLACKLNFRDEQKIGCESEENCKNNALIILDAQTLEFDILRGIDVASLCSIQLDKQDKIAIVLNCGQTTKICELDHSGVNFDVALKKEWTSPLTDFGYSNKIKHVRNFSIFTKYDVSVTIFSEKTSKTFVVKGKDTLSKIKVNLKGKQIGIKICTTEKQARVGNVKLEIELLDYGFVE